MDVARHLRHGRHVARTGPPNAGAHNLRGTTPYVAADQATRAAAAAVPRTQHHAREAQHMGPEFVSPGPQGNAVCMYQCIGWQDDFTQQHAKRERQQQQVEIGYSGDSR